MNSEILSIKKINGIQDMRAVLDAFDDAFEPTISESVSDLDAHSKKLIEKAENYLFLSGNKICGWISFYDNDVVSKIGYLTHIVVDNKYRGRGIGSEMLRFFEKECKERGMKSLKLEVNKGNKNAQALYKKNGYTFCGEETPASFYMKKTLD